MDSTEHEALESWAKKFGGTAILGFICTLLCAGKFLHHASNRRGLVCGIFIIPSAVISGILGLIWFCVMDKVDPEMTSDLEQGLEGVKSNLINFVFAALILGLTCSRTTSQHTSFRGVITSLLHEGMPMVIYSQILIWGQSTCCLLVLCILNLFNAKIPSLFAAMVPLGVEAGEDVVVVPVYNNFWSQTVVQEAESLGLVAACLTGIVLISGKPFFVARGWVGQGNSRDSMGLLQHGSGQAEAFERAPKRSTIPRSSTVGNLILEKTSPLTDLHYSGDKTDPDKLGSASLGAHLSLIALTVFLSFGMSLFARILEIELNVEHRLLSGIRMFKLAMCCALFSMQFILSRSRMRFKRDWFMRLCGLMLDLLVISALSISNPKPKALQETHYLICGCFVLVCLAWNLFCFGFVARQLFPNYWFERALTLTGDAMGHAYTGLLFVRTLDPAMESPVPAAYAYKLMLFFIPSSGGKNTIVVTMVSHHGPWAALVVCLCVVATWLIIFETYFKHRFVMTLRNGSRLPQDTLLSRDSKDKDLMMGAGGNSGVGSSKELRTLELTGASDSDPLMSTFSYDLHEDRVLEVDRTNRSHDSVEEPSKSTNSNSATVVSSDKSTAARRVSSTAGGAGGAGGGGGSTGGMTSLHSDSHPSQVPAPIRRSRIQTSEASSILAPEHIDQISGWMPDTRSNRAWTLKYSLRRDGASLDTMLSLCISKDRHGHFTHTSSVMVIEDSWGYIFGGYIGTSLENRASYYGSGESFVFSVLPVAQVHRWTGANNFFVISSSNIFAMGGGAEGFALQLDDELDTGVSNRSATFENSQLSSSEFFKCLNVEVWGLDDLGSV